jgi:hypothetical protein
VVTDKQHRPMWDALGPQHVGLSNPPQRRRDREQSVQLWPIGRSRQRALPAVGVGHRVALSGGADGFARRFLPAQRLASPSGLGLEGSISLPPRLEPTPSSRQRFLRSVDPLDIVVEHPSGRKDRGRRPERGADAGEPRPTRSTSAAGAPRAGRSHSVPSRTRPNPPAAHTAPPTARHRARSGKRPAQVSRATPSCRGLTAFAARHIRRLNCVTPNGSALSWILAAESHDHVWIGTQLGGNTAESLGHIVA